MKGKGQDCPPWAQAGGKPPPQQDSCLCGGGAGTVRSCWPLCQSINPSLIWRLIINSLTLSPIKEAFLCLACSLSFLSLWGRGRAIGVQENWVPPFQPQGHLPDICLPRVSAPAPHRGPRAHLQCGSNPLPIPQVCTFSKFSGLGDAESLSNGPRGTGQGREVGRSCQNFRKSEIGIRSKERGVCG